MLARPRLVTPAFALTCLATLLFFTSLTMQGPVFPAFLRDRAHAADWTIGLFIGLFSVVGVLLRPFVGRALRTGSRKRFMMLGGLVTAAAAVLYLASGNLAYLMGVRLAHGLSIAAYYTAASTMVADAAPEERRGEALSYFSMFLYVGLAGGGALGLGLQEGPGLTAVFLGSAGIGLACALVSVLIPEPSAHTPEGIEIEKHPLISRPALFPGAVLALGAFGYASILNFTADFAGAEGIGGRTLYFPVLAISVIVVRLFAGLVSDRFGRLVVGGPGLALFAIGVLLQSGARDTGSLLFAAAIAGIGFGFFFPSMMAFTIDRVRPVERGSAMGTFTGAFDLGFGIGSLALGTIKDATDYPTMYRGAAAFVAVGVLLLVAGARRATRSRA